PADLLQPLTAMANDDRLLPGALDPDDGMDEQAIVLFLEFLNRNRQAVGQLLTQPPRELLADDFGCQELRPSVRDLIGRKMRRRFRQVAGDDPGQLLELSPLER